MPPRSYVKRALIAPAILAALVAASPASARPRPRPRPLSTWQAQQRSNQVALSSWALPGGTVATSWSPPTSTNCDRFGPMRVDCSVLLEAKTTEHY